MTKRGVPGVWTDNHYGGWAPNFLIFIANTHNSIGRIYETQNTARTPYDVTPGGGTTAGSGTGPTPPLAGIKWGPRNNVNIQQSALLLGLQFVAQQPGNVPRELLPEEQARRRARARGGAVRLGDPRRPTAAR